MPSLALQLCLGGGIKEKSGKKTRGLNWRIYLHPLGYWHPKIPLLVKWKTPPPLFCIVQSIERSLSKIRGTEKGPWLIHKDRCDFSFTILYVFMYVCVHIYVWAWSHAVMITCHGASEDNLRCWSSFSSLRQGLLLAVACTRPENSGDSPDSAFRLAVGELGHSSFCGVQDPNSALKLLQLAHSTLICPFSFKETLFQGQLFTSSQGLEIKVSEGWEYNWVVECWPHMHVTLNSIPHWHKF